MLTTSGLFGTCNSLSYIDILGTVGTVGPTGFTGTLGIQGCSLSNDADVLRRLDKMIVDITGGIALIEYRDKFTHQVVAKEYVNVGTVLTNEQPWTAWAQRNSEANVKSKQNKKVLLCL